MTKITIELFDPKTGKTIRRFVFKDKKEYSKFLQDIGDRYPDLDWRFTKTKTETKADKINKKLKEISREMREVEKELEKIDKKLGKYLSSIGVVYAIISGVRIKKIEDLEEREKQLRKKYENLAKRYSEVYGQWLAELEKESTTK